MTRIAILNDYQRAALESADWAPVEALADIDVLTEPFEGEDDAIARLQDYEVLCVMRERLPISRRLIEGLPPCGASSPPAPRTARSTSTQPTITGSS